MGMGMKVRPQKLPVMPPLWLLVACLAAGSGVLAASQAPTGEPPLNWTQARQHWAFRPPHGRPPRAVGQRNWPAQQLDRSTLPRLEQRRLAPSPQADSRTLIRRVTLDLTGLPPTPGEVEAFVRECAAERQSGGVEERKSG